MGRDRPVELFCYRFSPGASEGKIFSYTYLEITFLNELIPSLTQQFEMIL